jgi:uncharacterized repeat protein (TIGR01451 family)
MKEGAPMIASNTRHPRPTTGSVILAAAVCLLLVGGGPNVASSEPVPVKVTICHRTNSVSNPYNKITVSLNAVDGEGHSDHQGHDEGGIFDPAVDYPPNQKDWGDIIPPFDENGDQIPDPSFPGSLNWPLGQTIFENGDCEVTGELTDNPGLTIEKRALQPVVGIEENVVFSIVVTSTGNATAEDVTLSDTLPAIPGVESWIIDPDFAALCLPLGDEPFVLSCSYGDMAPASSFTVEVSSSATSPDSCGAFTNVATADASNTAPVSDDAVAEVDCSGSTS